MIDYAKKTEKALFELLPETEKLEEILFDSMRYSLGAGGKRVRPALVFSFNKLCGGNEEVATLFACAVEMIHTYSLIHDDLPCMDDDDMRRGKPSNHIMFGEDIALLAGDALLTKAFEIISSEKAVELAGAKACCKAVNVLASYTGADGMVGGQVIDLINENKNAPVEILREMDYKKTACLIKSACELGCICANADDELVKLASEYGECIGLAFQIQDDILDVTSTEVELGKPIGSDSTNSKSTYVSLLGIDECKKIVKELTEKAINSLKKFEGDTSELENLANYLADRKN